MRFSGFLSILLFIRLAFLTLPYFLYCVIHSPQACALSPFRGTRRDRFQSSPNSSLYTAWFFLSISSCIWGWTSNCVTQFSLHLLLTSVNCTQIRYIQAPETCNRHGSCSDQHFQALKIKVWLLSEHLLVLRTFCYSKLSISSTPIQG